MSVDVNKESIKKGTDRIKNKGACYASLNYASDESIEELVNQMDIHKDATEAKSIPASTEIVTVKNLKKYSELMDTRENIRHYACEMRARDYAEKRDEKIMHHIDYYARIIRHIIIGFLIIILMTVCLVCGQFDRMTARINELESRLSYATEETCTETSSYGSEDASET